MRDFTASQHGWLWPSGFFLVELCHRKRPRSPLVDIALKLNVVVVCAVFLFVGAILIGAF
jgi:hypothetical protein